LRIIALICLLKKKKLKKTVKNDMINIILILKGQQMYNNNFENQEVLNEKKFKELTIQFERMERDYNKLVADLQIDITKIGEYLDDQENFDEESWKAMEAFKEGLDEKYQALMNQKTDQAKSKNAWDNLKALRPHWIAVR